MGRPRKQNRKNRKNLASLGKESESRSQSGDVKHTKKTRSENNVPMKRNGMNHHANGKKDGPKLCQDCGLFCDKSHQFSAEQKASLKCSENGRNDHLATVFPNDAVSLEKPLNNYELNVKFSSEPFDTRKNFLNGASDSFETRSGEQQKKEDNNNKKEFADKQVGVGTQNYDLHEKSTQTPVDIELECGLETRKEEANALYRQKKFGLALAEYTKLIELLPDNESYYSNRAACYMMMNKWDDALIDAKKAVEMNSYFMKGYDRLIKIAIALGNFSEVDSALKKWTELDPTNKSLEIERERISGVRESIKSADENYENKKYARALTDINKVLKICKHCTSYQIKKGEYLAQLGRWKDAATLASSILERDDKNIDAKFIVAICLYQSDTDKAVEYLKQLLRYAPDHRKALDLFKRSKELVEKKQEGNEAFQKKNYRRAHEIYNETAAIDPNNRCMMMKLYCNMALASYKMNNLENAIDECTRALKIDPNYVKALMRRGKCYADMGEYDEAIEDLSKAYELDPKNDCWELLNEAKILCKRAESDYHAILGVRRYASPEELKKAYKEKAFQHHPDRHSNASEAEQRKNERKFKNVTQAYRNLSSRHSSRDDEDESVPAWFHFYMNREFGFHRRNFYS